MIDAWLHGLLVQTLALSLATVAVRVLQATVLRRLGAAAAYLCWLLVPVAMGAVALPHPAIDSLVVRVDVSAVAPAWIATPRVEAMASHGVAGMVAAATWFAGALLLAAMLVQRQRRFEALVDAPANDAVSRLPAGSGPAVLGVWRRRIVLPQDFDSAFDAEQRRLMLLHEGVHLRRADNLWNLLAATLLVLHWFNPIAWCAWRRMRADQEMSCDAAVLRHESPESLATYAGALLKVQGVALTPPLATSWQSIHPLVERVRMLQVHRISSARHRAGLRIAALSIFMAGFGGYALRAGASVPPSAAASGERWILLDIQVKRDDSATHKTSFDSHILLSPGATVRLDPHAAFGQPFELISTASRLDGDRIQFETTVRSGSPLATLGSPRVITHDGEAATVNIKSDDGRAFTLTFVGKLVAPEPEALQGAGDARQPVAGALGQRAL